MSFGEGSLTAGNIEKVISLYSAIENGKWEAVNAILSPDIVVKEADTLPYGGNYKGHDGFKDLMTKLDDIWIDRRVVDFNIAAVDEIVLTNFRLVAANRATGRELDMPLVEKWTFRDDLIVEGEVFYYDTQEVRRICGLS